jgi:hypothetical protein
MRAAEFSVTMQCAEADADFGVGLSAMTWLMNFIF